MPRQGRAAVRLPVRNCVTLMALVAFLLQSLLLQTHIHTLALPASQDVHAGAPASGSPLKSQDNSDQAGCRLCQEIVHAGTFVAPEAAFQTVFLTVSALSLLKLPAVTAALPVAFAWKSRAPPRR